MALGGANSRHRPAVGSHRRLLLHGVQQQSELSLSLSLLFTTSQLADSRHRPAVGSHRRLLLHGVQQQSELSLSLCYSPLAN